MRLKTHRVPRSDVLRIARQPVMKAPMKPWKVEWQRPIARTDRGWLLWLRWRERPALLVLSRLGVARAHVIRWPQYGVLGVTARLWTRGATLWFRRGPEFVTRSEVAGDEGEHLGNYAARFLTRGDGKRVLVKHERYGTRYVHLRQGEGIATPAEARQALADDAAAAEDDSATGGWS